MPKIKDLGINVIPGTMRPPEIGGGGGCGHSCVRSCRQHTIDSDTDQVALCLTADPGGCNPCQNSTPQRGWYRAETDAPADCLTAPACHPCQPGTFKPKAGMANAGMANAGMAMMAGGAARYGWDDTDFCLTAPNDPNCVCQLPSHCGCTNVHTFFDDIGCARGTQCLPTACPGGSHCTAGSLTVTVTPNTPQVIPGTLTRDDIAAIRTQLKEYLDIIDAAEKALLPTTLEGVEAREKVLQTELEQLKARRSELKKS